MVNKIELVQELELLNKLCGSVNYEEEWDWVQSKIAEVTSLIFFSSGSSASERRIY
jgi:hypothetical protein